MHFTKLEIETFQCLKRTFRQANRDARVYQKTIAKEQKAYYKALKKSAKAAKKQERKDYLDLCKGACQLFKAAEAKLRRKENRKTKKSEPKKQKSVVQKQAKKPAAAPKKMSAAMFKKGIANLKKPVQEKEAVITQSQVETVAVCTPVISRRDYFNEVKNDVLNYAFVVLANKSLDWFFVELDMTTLQPLLRFPLEPRNYNVYKFGIHSYGSQKFRLQVYNKVSYHTSFEIVIEEDLTKSVPQGFAELRKAVPRADNWNILVDMMKAVEHSYPFAPNSQFFEGLYQQ